MYVIEFGEIDDSIGDGETGRNGETEKSVKRYS
jgi:hypothetical protein